VRRQGAGALGSGLVVTFEEWLAQMLKQGHTTEDLLRREWERHNELAGAFARLVQEINK
jgi:hypothetical protein